jgi:hypothetical protein
LGGREEAIYLQECPGGFSSEMDRRIKDLSEDKTKQNFPHHLPSNIQHNVYLTEVMLEIYDRRTK